MNTPCEKGKRRQGKTGRRVVWVSRFYYKEFPLMGVDSPRPVSHALMRCADAQSRTEEQGARRRRAKRSPPSPAPPTLLISHLHLPSSGSDHPNMQSHLTIHSSSRGDPPADPTVIYNPITTQGIVTPASHAREPSRYHMQERLWAHTPSPTTPTCNLFSPSFIITQGQGNHHARMACKGIVPVSYASTPLGTHPLSYYVNTQSLLPLIPHHVGPSHRPHGGHVISSSRKGITTSASHAREPSQHHMQARLWAHTPSPTKNALAASVARVSLACAALVDQSTERDRFNERERTRHALPSSPLVVASRFTRPAAACSLRSAA